MDSKKAIAALLALGQKTRLNAYRLLLVHSPDGLKVTEVSTRLGANISTISRHLRHLERTGLLHSRRVEREIIYAVHNNGIQQLTNFLTKTCCRANSESCEWTNHHSGK